jgi:hypothetical protein
MAESYVHPQFIGDQSGGTGVPPAGWLRDNIRQWFTGGISALMRGEPAPMAKRDQYPNGSPIAKPARFGGFTTILTRRYDRGAYAYGYRFGAMTYDPLGPGVVTTRPLPVQQPAATQLPYGIGLWWSPQEINYGIMPAAGEPLMTPQQVAALMGNNPLAGTLAATDYTPPEENGFGG